MFSLESPHTTYHFQYKEEKSALIILNLPLWDFFKGPKDEFETVVVDEPPVFEPLKFYCISLIFSTSNIKYPLRCTVEKKEGTKEYRILLFSFLPRKNRE